MARSLKKGPFADAHLLKKIDAMNESGDKSVDHRSRKKETRTKIQDHMLSCHMLESLHRRQDLYWMPFVARMCRLHLVFWNTTQDMRLQ